MNLEYTPGKMDVGMRDPIRKTKSMDSVFTLGQTQSNMQVGGVMENNMDLESSYLKKVKRN
jgi:hypothetical protein